MGNICIWLISVSSQFARPEFVHCINDIILMFHCKASVMWLLGQIFPIYRLKKVFFKTLVDEVQELEALSKDPGAVVHGKRYSYTAPPHRAMILDLHHKSAVGTKSKVCVCVFWNSFFQNIISV